MFTSLKIKLLLFLYIFLILSIPVGAYLVSQRQNPKISAKEEKPVTNLKGATPSSNLKDLSENLLPKIQPQDEAETKTTTPATSFGPTLNLKLILEGRPIGKMASKIFVGIAETTAKTTIKYLLSFNIDLPDTGEFRGLSLAGLTAGSNYQAVIKGPAQIATSSAFIMSPTITNLNAGQPIQLITGDLNEDNIINSADYSIAKGVFGTTPKSLSWNENIDFNKDGIINSADIALIIKNMAKAGDSGVWISTPATKSGTPTGGYWLFVPGF